MVRDQQVRNRLGHLKAAHERLLQAIETTQPALIALPANEPADLPFERETQYRFTGLYNQAKEMANKWEGLAREYELMAEHMMDWCDADQEPAQGGDDVQPMVERLREIREARDE